MGDIPLPYYFLICKGEGHWNVKSSLVSDYGHQGTTFFFDTPLE